uniref:Nucleoporin NDC1 n=1 Tax=Paramormyrops kingsleyae TaxID=1676925 RepID=A0A3B3SF57_9TELE|nr:nucleoporin NDC1 isoform X1 [Paramormyrops kingsleyae]
MLPSAPNHWFVRKVIYWRWAASVAWSLLLLPVCTALFVLLSRVSLLHPIGWISESFGLLCGSYVIFSLVLLFGVLLVVGFFNLEYYTAVPSIPCTKIALLGKVLHPRQCIHMLVHCMLGMLVAWCTAAMIGGRYRTLSCPCAVEEGAAPAACLNELHLFFLLAGGFVGYSYSLLGLLNNVNYISFKIIQRHKYLWFRSSLLAVVRYSAVRALYAVRNFCIFYYFLGYIPRTWICSTLGLLRDSSLHRLDSLAGLLDLPLLYHLWLSCCFLLLTWHVSVLLFRIFVSEAYSFPVQSSFSEDTSQCLPKVISEKEPMILKFLGLQDLAVLAHNSPCRRQEVFSLSQPGGHPHNWNAICTECLALLGELTQRLVLYQEVLSSNGRSWPPSCGSDHKSTSSETSENSGTEELSHTPRVRAGLKTPASSLFRAPVGGAGGTLPFTPDLDSPFSPAVTRRMAPDPSSPWHGSVQSPHLMRRGPKLWTSSAESPPDCVLPESPAAVPSPPAGAQKPSFLSLWFQNRQEQVKGFLAKRVLIMYLFNKLPEASSQALFADSQMHIWALQGLSHLVAASFTEDKFGVVQITLPRILSTMLMLQEAVDRHFKLPHASSKPMRSTCCLEDSTFKMLRFGLRSALKTALYRITGTFGQHLHAVQMSAEHRKRLQLFMDYKE